MNEEVNGEVVGEQKPFITIDDVQINIEDLPEEGQAVFGRLQRLNQKKVIQVLDLEELQAGINFFTNRIVDIVNNDGEETVSEDDTSEEEDTDSE